MSTSGPPRSWRIVAVGEWVYDETVARSVWIVEANWDFWFALAEVDGHLEPDDSPDLNAAGLAYDACFNRPDEHFWPHEGPRHDVPAAERAAERRVPGTIAWT